MRLQMLLACLDMTRVEGAGCGIRGRQTLMGRERSSWVDTWKADVPHFCNKLQRKTHHALTRKSRRAQYIFHPVVNSRSTRRSQTLDSPQLFTSQLTIPPPQFTICPALSVVWRQNLAFSLKEALNNAHGPSITEIGRILTKELHTDT